MGRLLKLFAVLALGCLALGAQGDAEQPTEAELQAALLFKFSKFVTWPEAAFDDDEAPLVFAVVADREGLPAALESVLRGQTVHGRPVAVEAFEDVQALGPCHVLFVDSSVSNPATVLAATRGQSVLVVGARARFAHRGGAINLYRRGGGLRFEINPAAVRRAHQNISSKLLRLARVVEDSRR